MRHKKSGRHFNINRNHYKSIFMNMCNSLVEKEIIKTTLNKAKELRSFIEPIINLSKNYSICNIRLIFSKLRDKNNVYKLMHILGPLYKNINGGYTRIIKCSINRFGDNSKMAYIELINKSKKK